MNPFQIQIFKNKFGNYFSFLKFGLAVASFAFSSSIFGFTRTVHFSGMAGQSWHRPWRMTATDDPLRQIAFEDRAVCSVFITNLGQTDQIVKSIRFLSHQMASQNPVRENQNVATTWGSATNSDPYIVYRFGRAAESGSRITDAGIRLAKYESLLVRRKIQPTSNSAGFTGNWAYCVGTIVVADATSGADVPPGQVIANGNIAWSSEAFVLGGVLTGAYYASGSPWDRLDPGSAGKLNLGSLTALSTGDRGFNMNASCAAGCRVQYPSLTLDECLRACGTFNKTSSNSAGVNTVKVEGWLDSNPNVPVPNASTLPSVSPTSAPGVTGLNFLCDFGGQSGTNYYWPETQWATYFLNRVSSGTDREDCASFANYLDSGSLQSCRNNYSHATYSACSWNRVLGVDYGDSRSGTLYGNFYCGQQVNSPAVVSSQTQPAFVASSNPAYSSGVVYEMSFGKNKDICVGLSSAASTGSQDFSHHDSSLHMGAYRNSGNSNFPFEKLVCAHRHGQADPKFRFGESAPFGINGSLPF